MNATTLGITKLSTLFRNLSYLPTLPPEVQELVAEINDPRSTIDRLAQILGSNDAALTTFRRLCIAHEIEPDDEGHVWLRAAIYLIGANAARRFVIANLIQQVVSIEINGCLFDSVESINRSQTFGLMSECVFSSPESLCFSELPEPGAFYVAEILHELPRALLAIQAPGTYNRITLAARTNQTSFEREFELLFDCCLAKIGEFAVQGWGLMGAIGASLTAEVATFGSKVQEHAA